VAALTVDGVVRDVDLDGGMNGLSIVVWANAVL
jgi:hypothetical protein